jgi:hypothetical protein
MGIWTADGKKIFKSRLCYLNFNLSSLSGNMLTCMQFADSAGKFACGAQFCTCKEFNPLKESKKIFIITFLKLKI